MVEKKPRFLRRLWAWFSSLRVLFWLLTTLALLSLVGAFVIQNAPPHAYLELYGEGWSGIIFALGLDDVFGAFYFVALEVLLALSLVACVANRLRGRLRSGAKTSGRVDFSFNVSTEPRRFITLTSSRLKRRGWKVKKPSEESLSAEHSAFGWWASLALHLGAVLFLLAGLFKVTLERESLLVLFEGQAQLLPPELGELEVVATDFDTLRDPNSDKVLTYYTELTTRPLDGEGSEPARIEVNHPHRVDGLTFYQYLVDERSPVELLVGPPESLEAYAAELGAHIHSALYPTAVELRAEAPPVEFEELSTPPEDAALPDDDGGTPADEETSESDPAAVSPPVLDDAPAPLGEANTDEPVSPEPLPVETSSDVPPAPVRGGGFVQAPLGGEAVTLPDSPYRVRALEYLPADPDAGIGPAVIVELYRDGEVLADEVPVYERQAGYTDPRLEELGLRLILGSVRYTSTPRPERPGEVEVLRCWGGDYPGEGSWIASRLAGVLFVGFESGLGLTVGGPDGERVVLDRPLDSDPTATAHLDEDTALAYSLADEEPITGLLVKRDPGLWLFWPAAALTALGSLLLLFFPHRRLWLSIVDGRVEIETRRLTEAELRRLLSPEGGGLG